MQIDEISTYAVKNAKQKGADDVVCKTIRNVTKQIRFANNQITATKVYDSLDINLFLTWRNRVVGAEINNINRIDSSIDDLISLAKVSNENKNYYGIADGTYTYRAKKYDKTIPKLDEELVDYVENSINSALESGAKRSAGVLYATLTEKWLATSNNIEIKDLSTYIEISVRSFTDKDASGHGLSCATKLSEFKPESAGRDAGEIAKLASNPVECEPGKFNVILDSQCFANLMDFIGMAVSYFYVDTGLSFFADKLNKDVASPKVTIYDDGTIDEGIGSSKFDDEGVPTNRTVLIKNGRLKNYLHNTSTAYKFKTKTTANAGLIIPQPWNLCLESGDYTKNELFAELKNGIYVTNTWYTRFQNYQEGDFSTVPRDGIFLIKNGEIVKSIKNIRISDNILHLLKNIEAIGKNMSQIHWWDAPTPTFAPCVLIKDITISKYTQ